MAEWRDKFVPTYAVGLVFWMPAQALNFALLRTRFRVIYVGLCTYVEVNILAVMRRIDIEKWLPKNSTKRDSK